MPLRKMEISDIPAILALQQELQFQDWNAKQFESEIKASYSYCTVFTPSEEAAPKEILGYAIFHLLGPDSELLSIATGSNHQRKGIGQILLESGLQQLDFSHGDCCFLEVRKGNLKARNFYEKNGFIIYNSRKNYYSDGEDAILYKKEI